MTVRCVFRFISFDYEWQFSYPLIIDFTIYITLFTTEVAKNYLTSSR
jgi:hypothetical protein